MKPLSLLILAFLLCSCSANWLCKRCLERGKVIRDTVRIDTTIFIPQVTVDSVFVPYPETSVDTLVITQERIKIKFRDLPGPTVFVSAECPADTVRIEKEVLVPVEIKTGFGLWALIGTGVGVFLLMCVVVYVATRR